MDTPTVTDIKYYKWGLHLVEKEWLIRIQISSTDDSTEPPTTTTRTQYLNDSASMEVDVVIRKVRDNGELRDVSVIFLTCDGKYYELDWHKMQKSLHKKANVKAHMLLREETTTGEQGTIAAYAKYLASQSTKFTNTHQH